MKIFSSIFVVAIFAAPWTAAAQSNRDIGYRSCATWLSSRPNEGDAWIMGYWTGRNRRNNLAVPAKTDIEGILAEVQKVCEGQPSLTLLHATKDVYAKPSKR